MKKFEVCIEGSFTKEFYVDAETEEDARAIAEEKFELLIGLDKEDYVVDSVTTTVSDGL